MSLPHRLKGYLLWLATSLFLARVMGQILVGIYATPYLPAWQEWYSGILPYPWLLLSQFLLLMLMTAVNLDNIRQRSDLFHVISRTARRVLNSFAAIYAVSMVLRYTIRMIQMPDQRWLGGTIPIWFHLVLAAWVFLLACPSSSLPCTAPTSKNNS